MPKAFLFFFLDWVYKEWYHATQLADSFQGGNRWGKESHGEIEQQEGSDSSGLRHIGPNPVKATQKDQNSMESDMLCMEMSSQFLVSLLKMI